MKALIAVAAAAVVATGAASPAQAREGCGRGYHRASNGMCRADRGTYARWVEGHYYPGRGYWHHGRWYNHRHTRRGVYIYI
jgi:hypothetical protein